MATVSKTVKVYLKSVSISRPLLHRISTYAFACTVIATIVPSIATAQSSSASTSGVNVTTFHNDIGRTGQNLSETILNTTNVNATQFGKLFAQKVDGQIYAQPLYMSGITVNGALHNVVLVSTENDSVYAFDADTNGGTNSAPLWQASMLSTAHSAAAGATTVPSTEVGSDIYPQVGITGTPVIDPTTGTYYVVSKALENGSAVQRLHALDVTTGLEKFGGPVVLKASVAGTGIGSVNGVLAFDPLWENQRPGLLLLNGIVYIGFASHGDSGPWHGWILSYNAATLAQVGIYNASPNGNGSGFWAAGAGLPADQLDTVNHPFGRMFVPTGNGDYNATKPYTNTMDYGDSHLDLDLTNGQPTVTDEFTTNQQADLNSEDGDVGSGGLMVIPTQTTGNYPHLAVQAGKQGTLYLLNRDNLGGYNNSADQIVQETTYAVGNVGVWSTPAYWNGNVYYWGRNDYLKAFPLVNGGFSSAPVESSEQYGYPGATPSISANGNSQGIVWSIDSEYYSNPGPAVLQAHNASNVTSTLYTSTTNPSRDTPGTAVKFAVPTVVNGKVYVPTSTELDIYGLINGNSQTQAPVLAPSTSSFSTSTSVTITDGTPNATIYYTTDGTAPTTSSNLYTGPITVASTETITAFASAGSLISSLQTSATYTDLTQAAPVAFSVAAGTYNTNQTVALTDSSANVTIYYTTNGSTPTTASTVYSAPITVSSPQTISAFAVGGGLTASPVTSAVYTINLGATGVSFSQGFSASKGIMILNGSTGLNDSRLQLTDGNSGEAGSAWYYTKVNVQAFSTTFTFQLSNPNADGITFAIQNAPKNVNALGGNANYLGYANIPNSLAIKFAFYDSTLANPALADETGLYLNGAVPTTNSIDLSQTGINLHSDDLMSVTLIYNGTTLYMTITDTVTQATWSTNWTVNIPSSIGSTTAYVGFTGSTGSQTASQKILTWSYVVTTPTNATATPTFLPAAGAYTSAQTVTISDATAGASVYYTTNGTTPTSASALYSGPISVSATETINAIAVLTGNSNSAVASSAYTISQPAAATPGFSVSPGTYSSAQTVSITDATTSAAIYYTLNGSTPTAASTLYTGPIAVSATETINAIAVATGYSNSAVASAAYTISLPQAATPGFSLSPGTYTSAQTVSISDATATAAIYYTLNGSTPTAASTLYTGPIAVGATETINAIAVATGYSNSAVGSAAYTISITLPIAATPTFSPLAGTYSVAQTVAISDSTASATIYYTTNGSTPTSASAVYASPIAVSASETINAIAMATGYTASAMGSAAYTISIPTVATPAFSVASGTYAAAQTVAISDATSGATIYYTTNGTAPSTASSQYTAPIAVSATETINAIAVLTGYTNSAVASAAYTIGAAAPPVINFASGFTTTGLNLYGATINNAALQLTDGGSGETRFGWYKTPVNVQSFTTDFTFQLTSASADGFTFALQNSSAGIWALGQPGGGLGYGGMANSVAVKFDLYSNSGEGADSTGFYTAGATPTVPAVDMTSSGVNLHSGDLMHAHLTYNGTTITLTLTDTVTSASFTTSAAINIPSVVGGNTAYVGFTGATGGSTAVQNILTWTYSTGSATTPAVALPTFSLAPGTYTGTQTVSLADNTTGSSIYYTTTGATPTTASTLYTAPVSVTASETISAIAVETGYTSSSVATAAYTINAATLPTAATPGFSLASGTYTGTQTVSISDATAGVSIYYTVNGSTPTTASTLYTAPISVAATETISAIAIETGYTNSTVATAAYTINAATLPTAATPGFSLTPGTYASAQTVTISDATAGVSIYYTVNGSAPTTASTLYTAPISVAATETISAIAIETGYTNSAVATAAYTIGAASAPVINYATGFTTTGLNLYGATITNNALQLTDGGTGETRVGWYKTPVNVQSFTTDFTFQLTSATADGFTFTLQNAPAGVWAVGSTGGNLGYGGMANSVAVKFDLYSNAGEGTDSTGFYTAGAAPTVPSVDMTSSGVNLHSGDVLHAHIRYDGTNLTLTLTDTVTNATFTTTSAINIPTAVGGNTAYVGFTATTGSLAAVQNILTWTYSTP